MKNSITLISAGLTMIVCGLFAAAYWISNFWFLLVPISGFAIFIRGTIKFIKNLENGDD